MADLHKFGFIIFLLLLPIIGATSEDLKYSYEHDSIGDKDDASGDVTFRTYSDNGVIYEYAHVNIKWKGGFFKSSITDDFIQKKEQSANKLGITFTQYSKAYSRAVITFSEASKT